MGPFPGLSASAEAVVVDVSGYRCEAGECGGGSPGATCCSTRGRASLNDLMADPIPGRGVARAADPVSHPRAWPNLTLTLRQIGSVDLAE